MTRISIDDSSRSLSTEEARSSTAEESARPDAESSGRPDTESSGRPYAVDPPAGSRRQGQQPALPGARRSQLGIGVGMIGGVLIAVATFLPWLEFNGRVRSGWEIFELYRAGGTNPAVVSPMFGGGDYDIFFTGIITLSLAVLSLVLMAALLAIQKKETPGQARRTLALTASATLAIAAALVVTAVNLRTAQLGTLAFERGGVHYGLWVTMAASWAGTLGMAVSITGKRWRMPEPAEPETLAAAPDQASAGTAQSSAAAGRSASGVEQLASAPGQAASWFDLAASAPDRTTSGVDQAASAPDRTTSGVDQAASAPDQTTSGVEVVISALKSPVPRSRPTKAPSPSGSRGQGLVQALVLILFLVGIGGFVVAAAANHSIARTAASDARALGERDPAEASATLRTGFTSVNGAFNAYAAASKDVARARQDVTNRLTKVAALSTSGSGGLGAAQSALDKAQDAHAVAVEEARLARKAYVDRLAALMKDVHP